MLPNIFSYRRSFLKNTSRLDKSQFSIDCVDPLGRTALVLAIENENMPLIECLLKHGASPGDALLHAISEEYVEAVERLLIHEEGIHIPGRPYSWEQIDPNTSIYTRDISPLILAAHKNNYEILKLLLDRGKSFNYSQVLMLIFIFTRCCDSTASRCEMRMPRL